MHTAPRIDEFRLFQVYYFLDSGIGTICLLVLAVRVDNQTGPYLDDILIWMDMINRS